MPISSGWVPSHLLYRRVLNHRQDYGPQLAALRRDGLEDPFEITPEIKQHAHKIISRFGEKTQLGMAAVLLMSILPPHTSFRIGTLWHQALCAKEGGLEIRRSQDPKASLRRIYGSPLPKALLAAPAGTRSAACLEYSFLLTVLLRSAGIKARVEGDVEHAYVVALLDGKGYRIDAAKLEFEPLPFKEAQTDHKYTAVHYVNKASWLSERGREEALPLLLAGLEIDPECAQGWNNLGTYHKKTGSPERAMECFDKALEIEPNYGRAWRNKGDLLYEQGRFEEAREALRMVAKVKPELLETEKFKNMVRSLDEALSPPN